MINKKNTQYLIRKFVNHLIFDGKKEKAEVILKEAFNIIYIKENKDALLVFLKAVANTKPFIELRSVRRGGATYQVPVPLYEKRSLALSIKWLIENARKKRGYFSHNLSQTLIEASKNVGDSIKRREALHITALKNRSFTHFRWF